jgi:hypothetical protein
LKTFAISLIIFILFPNLTFPVNNYNYRATGQDSSSYLTKSITAGIGANIVNGRIGLYLTGNYIQRFSRNFSLGIGTDIFNDSDGENRIGLLFNINPLVRIDILSNKISLFGGVLGGFGIGFSEAGGGGIGAVLFYNIEDGAISFQ